VNLASTLADGADVILVFTSAGCGPCEALLPEVSSWQRSSPSERLRLMLVARGSRDDLASMRKQYVLNDLLVQDDGGPDVQGLYRVIGTPTAVWISGGDQTIVGVAHGGPAIRDLVHYSGANGDANGRELQAPRKSSGPNILEAIRRADVPVGRATENALQSGRIRAMIFWNASCGFCVGMLPQLQSWAINNPAAIDQVVVATAGVTDVETPYEGCLLMKDPDFRIGLSMGAQGTPSAVLLTPEGRPHSAVAAGAEAVLSLLEFTRSSPATAHAGLARIDF